MSIPYPTTTVTLLVPGAAGNDEDDWGDGNTDPADFTESQSGIRAHLSAPGANASFQTSGSVVSYEFRLLLDPCPLTENMRVRDENTGDEYQVNWCLKRPEPLAHVVAGVSRSIGSA